MSGCLDGMHCPHIEIDLGDKRNQIASVISGGLFFVGWWIIIDAAANSPLKNDAFYTCGVVSTIAFSICDYCKAEETFLKVSSCLEYFLYSKGDGDQPNLNYPLCGRINAVSNAQVRGETYEAGCLGQTGARIWLLIGFLMGFGALIASCWILFGAYVVPNDPDPWPGVACFLENALIFFSALIFKFGRAEEVF